MCSKDMMDALRAQGLNVTVPQVRWAIVSGKVSRPPLDGSLSFDFGPEQIEELVTHFRGRSNVRRSRESPVA